MPPRQSTPPPPGTPRRRPGPVMPSSWIWLVILATVVVGMILFAPLGSGNLIDFSDFRKLIDGKMVAKVTISGKNLVVGEIKEDVRDDPFVKSLKLHRNKFATKIPETNDQATLAQAWIAKDPGLKVTWEEEHGVWLQQLLSVAIFVVLPLLVIFFILQWRMRDPLGGGFLTSYIKSPARRYEKSKMRITFEDVADMENAKSELQEIVDFLRSPEKFQRLGAQVPKGVLLVGPPGTGKTLLARAVAGEAGVPFYSISGSEFIQMFVGVGASRVRDMFKTAKENAPCLLFVDEIDAVGRMRGTGVGGGSDEREQTLNQILSEMDGFQPNEMVIVLAATNRPDVLDAALLRPGRFDRHVTIDRPTWQGRLAILKVHTRTKPLGDDVNLELIARKMIGMTGADLRNLANEAALLATRVGKNKIERDDFEQAMDRVLRGPKREEVLTAEEKRRTAYHEAGHALVTWLVPGADRPIKVSIIPRGRSLGVNMLLPENERMDIGLDGLKSQLVTIMGGRAADRLVLGQPYAGAENDIKQATKIARYMVTHWGMSERLGPMSFRIGEEHIFLGKELQEARDFSEGTAQIIDEEVQKLLREADEKAFALLKDNREDLNRLTEHLLLREELSRDEIDELLKNKAPKTSEIDGQQSTGVVFAPVGRD